MSTMEYPYQLTAFIDAEPQPNEPVYYGANGWYPQVALKRRFKLVNGDETAFLDRLAAYCSHNGEIIIKTDDVLKPDHMPVAVIEVEQNDNLMRFHRNFIAMMGNSIESSFPERDGEHYFPHVTVEYNGKPVVETSKYTQRQYVIKRVWLLKDIDDENSKAYKSFDLNDGGE